jgi:acetyl-CoA carboxylase biotin carboxyl carrier protein
MTDASSEQDVFDVGKIRHLVELMEQHDLSEIDLRQGEMRIQLRRGREPAGTDPRLVPGVGLPAAGLVTGLVPTAAGSAEESAAAGAAAAADPEHLAAISSPMVGTFYAAPDPDSPPYVKVGDHVGPETTVCIVEAMKILNHIPAEVSGKIVSVLVENGEPVEYGQRMFEVDTRE